MQVKIAPSILSCDFSQLGEEIKRIDATTAEYIHVDVMDGIFVPNITIGHPIVKQIRPFTKKVFDVHLMIIKPEKYIKGFADAGADIISVHRENEYDVKEVLKEIRGCGKKASIVYNPDTNADDIEDYFPYIDQMLIMSVHPGFGGQSFIVSSLEKGEMVRRKIDAAKAAVDLEIDGGVDFSNAARIRDAGFNVLVSGNTIFRADDLAQAVEKLRNN
ncbi:ribulose-phosphate 3-epimerase [Spirochaetota bacterium]